LKELETMGLEHSLEHLQNSNPSVEEPSGEYIVHVDPSHPTIGIIEGDEEQPGENGDVMNTRPLDVGPRGYQDLG
jgi:hypothetical protein